MGIKKVVVTGAGGFIGNHLVRFLIKKNFQVTALIKYNSKKNAGWLEDLYKKKPKNLNFKFGDIEDYQFIKKITHKQDAVINLAALISIPHSYDSPESYINTNLMGSFNILSAAKENRLKKILMISTSEVYGTAQYIPIDENHPLNAQSPYAASKVAADQLSLSFYRSFNLPVVIARPFNTFGPMQSTRAVIPNILVQFLNGKKTIRLGDIKSTRDFTFVEDTVAALEKILISKKTDGKIYNIGSNFEISISDVINTLSRITKKKIEIKIDKKRIRPSKSEVRRLYSSNKKIKKDLKWKTNYSGKIGFIKGLKKSLDWYSNKENLKFFKSSLGN